MSEFQVGDRVRCVDARGTNLEVGAEYTVSSVYRHLIRIQWIRACLYNGSRFEKVAQPAPPPPPAAPFKPEGEKIRVRTVTHYCTADRFTWGPPPPPEPTPTPHDEVQWLGVTVDMLQKALADANASLHDKDDTIRTQGERISELIEALKSANDTVKIQDRRINALEDKTEKDRGAGIRATDGLKLDLVKAHDEIDALQKELDFYYARLIEKLRTCAPA